MTEVEATARGPGDFGSFSFRLAGFPVHVRSSFFFTAVILGLAGRPTMEGIAVWIGVVFVSVLWHELGHATVARAFGLSPRIELRAMGGLTIFGGGAEPSWIRSLAISVAGPIAGLILGAIVWAVATNQPPVNDVARDLVLSALWVNVGWSLVNLIPLLPFDGGLAMEAILRRLTPRNSVFLSHAVSVLVGGAACGYALSARMFWAAYLAGSSFLSSGRALMRLRVGRRLQAGWSALLSGQAVDEAARAAEGSLNDESPAIQASASELLAWTALHRGDLAAARATVSKFPASHRPSPLLLSTLSVLEGRAPEPDFAEVDSKTLTASWLAMLKSWRTGRASLSADRLAEAAKVPGLPRDLLNAMSTALFYGEAFEASAAVSTRSFEIHGHPDDAYNAACSFARLHQLDEAMRWLERAVGVGYRDASHLQNDTDLAPLRARPEFAKIIRSI